MIQKKKLAVVSFPPISSGVTQYSLRLCEALSRDNRTPQVFFLCNNSVPSTESIDFAIVKLIGRTRQLPVTLMKFIKYIISRKIDIVHFQDFFKYPLLTYMLMFFLKKSGRKIVFTAHDIVPHYPRPYHAIIIRRIYQLADGVITHSKANAQELSKLAGRLEHTAVIPHGIFDQFRKPAVIEKKKARVKIGVPPVGKMILFFGRIDSRKGIDIFLKEMPKLLATEKNVFLVIAGRVAFPENYLSKIINQLGLGENVLLFNGHIPEEEVESFFMAADAVVLPYMEGTTSGVAKIAFAFKIPVIATNVGDLPETILAAKAGIIVHMPLLEAEVEEIASLLKGEKADLYQNYDQIMENHSWTSIARETIRFYCDLMGIKPAADFFPAGRERDAASL